MIGLIRLVHAGSDIEAEATVAWLLKRTFPRVDMTGLVFLNPENLTAEEIVDRATKLESERVEEPEPPYISHEMLVNNVSYMQEGLRRYGSKTLDVMIGLDLQYPHARLPEMIWQTHTDVSAEQIVSELYRREAAASLLPQPDGDKQQGFKPGGFRDPIWRWVVQGESMREWWAEMKPDGAG